MSEKLAYLNLGCGARYHPAWINLDIDPQGPGVIAADLSKGIPLPSESCDVVYHAAVLEHIRLRDAATFMTECKRVLRGGGILRVGVPDLEQIARLYLSKLTSALEGDATAASDYDWMMLEMLDQTVRERSGGEMLEYLLQTPIPNEAFVLERIGDEGRQVIAQLRNPAPKGTRVRRSIVQRIKERLDGFPARMRTAVTHRGLDTGTMRALEIGRFRLAGEVHHWMYDRFSLGRLLAATGFDDIQFHSAATSSIANWASFNLDVMPDGQVTKPDLFFAEARKPVTPVV